MVKLVCLKRPTFCIKFENTRQYLETVDNVCKVSPAPHPVIMGGLLTPIVGGHETETIIAEGFPAWMNFYGTVTCKSFCSMHISRTVELYTNLEFCRIA